MENLEVGFEFPPVSYELTPSNIAKYEEAVETSSPVVNFVPPLAIAAYAMKAISQTVPLPPGSVHTSQELEFFKPVAVGEHISCQARIIQKISRANLNMVMIEINTVDKNNEKILSGKATLTLANSR